MLDDKSSVRTFPTTCITENNFLLQTESLLGNVTQSYYILVTLCGPQWCLSLSFSIFLQSISWGNCTAAFCTYRRHMSNHNEGNNCQPHTTAIRQDTQPRRIA